MTGRLPCGAACRAPVYCEAEGCVDGIGRATVILPEVTITVKNEPSDFFVVPSGHRTAAANELARVEAPRPDTHALIPWNIDLCDGQIMIAGTAVHPVVAREIWMRLGTLIGAAERDAEQDEWERLGRDLDRNFRCAVPAQGRVVARGGSEVSGVVQREDEDRAAFRVATFSVALLKRSKKGWEGPVYAYRPLSIGHDIRALGMRVRLADEAIPALRPPLQLPAPTRRQLAGPVELGPVKAPVMSADLARRRAEIAAEQALVLALFTGPDQVASLDDLARGGRFPRATLILHLESLVDRRVLTQRKTPDGPAWQLRAADAPRFEGPVGTKMGKAPKPPKAAPAPKPPRKRKVKPPPPPPPPPPIPYRDCRACNTAARTLRSTCPRCDAPYLAGS